MVNATQVNVTTSATESPALVSLNQFGQQLGRTSVTLWRWRNLGWLDGIVNIAGKPYITHEGIEKFTRRAQAGEFAKEHHAPKKEKAKATAEDMR